MRLVEREDVTPEQLAEGGDAIRGELLQNRRNEFYSAYMGRVQEQLGVDIDYAAFDVAVGG